MLARPLTLLLALLLPVLVRAQFGGGFFQQMFGGDGDDGDDDDGEDLFEQVKQQQQQQKRDAGGQNFGSDSIWYRAQNDRITCHNYLCPDTLACVHFPHHCPCPFPANEDKIELGDGSRICVSQGGFRAGEAARKVELARKAEL